jgi:hypothetical protein
MAKVTPITEHFQRFLADMKDGFWGDVYGTTRVAWKKFLDAQSLRERDRWMELEPYERLLIKEREYRNGF